MNEEDPNVLPTSNSDPSPRLIRPARLSPHPMSFARFQDCTCARIAPRLIAHAAADNDLSQSASVEGFNRLEHGGQALREYLLDLAFADDQGRRQGDGVAGDAQHDVMIVE